MKHWLLNLLICPHCDTDGALTVFSEETEGDDIIKGTLSCPICNREYLIINGIPRFVEPEENYAKNFGYQWHRFRVAQIDRISAHSLSRSRLLNDTRWSIEWMQGKLILDAGCGAGRFTDELAQCGARVVACDISSAIDACKQTVDDPAGHASDRGEVGVVQANLLAMPFKKGAFEAIHCAGVIQHTPDPDKIMRTLPNHLQSNGQLFYNFYEIDSFTKFQVIKYLLRRWTPKWRMQTLVKFSRWMCYIFFVPSFVMSCIPVVRFFNRFLPICSVHPRGVPLTQQFNLTLLDTVDWYGPQYEIRQDHRKVVELLKEEGLVQVAAAEGFVWAIKQ